MPDLAPASHPILLHWTRCQNIAVEHTIDSGVSRSNGRLVAKSSTKVVLSGNDARQAVSVDTIASESTQQDSAVRLEYDTFRNIVEAESNGHAHTASPVETREPQPERQPAPIIAIQETVAHPVTARKWQPPAATVKATEVAKPKAGWWSKRG